MKRKQFLALLLALALCCVGLPALAEDWNAPETTLTQKLAEFGFSKMEELTVSGYSTVGIEAREDEALHLSTDARTVSHGDIYTAYVDFSIPTAIAKGETLVIAFSVKNEGEKGTNFLADIFAQGDKSRDSWLNRMYIFAPVKDGYTEYYVCGIAKDDAEGVTFELTMGWAAQQIAIDHVQAAKYPGTVKERVLEKLPLLSRKGTNGNLAWNSDYDVNASWRKDAAQMISDNRMGEIDIQVVDGSGAPVSGASVQVKMQDRAYHIGNAASADSFRGERADATYAQFSDFFNIVTFANDLKWGDSGWKGVGVNQDTYDALAYLAERGMDVHAHVLLWPGIDHDPYDDGIDQSAEFVTTPSFVVGTVHVIEALLRMNDPNGQNGYGDGTIGTLRFAADDAIAAYTDEKTVLQDELTQNQVALLHGMVDQMLTEIAALPDDATEFDGMADTLSAFQTTLRGIFLEHIDSFVTEYGKAGSIVEWDVINEVMNPGSRGAVTAIGEDIYLHDLSEICQDPLMVDAFKAARAAGGEKLNLSYNDTQWQANAKQREDTYNFYRYLVENDAPVTFFGLQAYVYPQSVGVMLDAKDTWAEYDKLMELGIGTEITEYGPSGFQEILPETERVQMFLADYLRNYLTVNYAHPGSIGFIAWGGIPTDNAVGSAYYKLVFDEWWTNETVITSENGDVALQGYLGEYEITVTTADGKTVTVPLDHLNNNLSGDKTTITITVE